jgi:hypothetical protein
MICDHLPDLRDFVGSKYAAAVADLRYAFQTQAINALTDALKNEDDDRWRLLLSNAIVSMDAAREVENVLDGKITEEEILSRFAKEIVNVPSEPEAATVIDDDARTRPGTMEEEIRDVLAAEAITCIDPFVMHELARETTSVPPSEKPEVDIDAMFAGIELQASLVTPIDPTDTEAVEEHQKLMEADKATYTEVDPEDLVNDGLLVTEEDLTPLTHAEIVWDVVAEETETILAPEDLDTYVFHEEVCRSSPPPLPCQRQTI